MKSWADVPPKHGRPGPGGYLRFLIRGTLILILAYGGLALLLAARLVERPICGPGRPVTQNFARVVSRAALALMGLRVVIRGQPMRKPGAIVANHSSWLDVFVLNAAQNVFFVAKSEVASWPLIGWLARATGTMFIARKGAEAHRQKLAFEARLKVGHRLLFFPEGTSSDSIRVLPFKSTLFQAFYAPELERAMHIQPVTVIYHAPPGEEPRFYGWWGDMEFFSHFLTTLAARRQGWVELIFHPEVPVDAFAGRKELAQHCERVIRTAHVNAVA
ncbi:MAG TPA: lysophospholipid acyltransferase family protein [Tabrizicola sp.]|nr:lysophospholipid acyltransferase family protein [Tabrizicola sp.]